MFEIAERGRFDHFNVGPTVRPTVGTPLRGLFEWAIGRSPHVCGLLVPNDRVPGAWTELLNVLFGQLERKHVLDGRFTFDDIAHLLVAQGRALLKCDSVGAAKGI